MGHRAALWFAFFFTLFFLLPGRVGAQAVLTVPNPAASNVTTTSATILVSPSGGSGTYHAYWERKTSDTDGYWVDAGLSDAPIVNLTGLSPSTYQNYRVTVTDTSVPAQSVTVGLRFLTLTPTAFLDAYCAYEFFSGGVVRLTMVVSGGDGRYSFRWSNPDDDAALNLNSETLMSQTLILTCSDAEVQHHLRVHIEDGAGHVWAINDSRYPTFSYPMHPYLRHTDTLLYPVSYSPKALPAGMKWRQQGDSTSEWSIDGQPTSYYVGQALQAAQGLPSRVDADFYNSAYGSGTAYAAQHKVETTAYLNSVGATDFSCRYAYNDKGLTPQQSFDNIRETITYIANNATTVKRIWILPTTFRNGGSIDWGDEVPLRLRDLQTLLSRLHATMISGVSLYFGSVLTYDMSQADSGIYTTDRYTHYADNGARAIGAYDANSVLTLFPVAANSPITDFKAGETRRFVFPIAGTIADQVVTWGVTKQGGGAAFGTIDQTGLYEAPATLPLGSGNTDVVTAVSAGGAVTHVTVVLASNGQSFPLDPPTNLTATVNSRSMITLTWQDNAAGEDGVSIEYSTDETNFTAVGTVGANKTTAAVSGLNRSTNYVFRLRAFKGTVTSPCSATVKAKTKML